MPTKKSILFFTNSESGQANIVLATAYELLSYNNVNVHIASFASLENRVSNLKAGAYGSIPSNTSITFHAIVGLSMAEVIIRNFDANTLAHACGIKAAVLQYPLVARLVTSWTANEYVQGYRSCLEIIKTVDPDVIVVEALCAQGREACVNLDRDYLILSPNSFREHSPPENMLKSMATYPALSSGYPYPLPYYLIPANIYLHIRLIFAMVFSSHIKELNKARVIEGMKGVFPLFEPYKKEVTYIIAGAPESDFPALPPSNIVPCGGIFLPSNPLSMVDPQLESWLYRGPTVLLSLGSLLPVDAAYARELALGFRILLDQDPRMQVLWKLKLDMTKVGKSIVDIPLYSEVTEILGKEISNGRVRIEQWLKPEPLSILQSGQITCFVHHGGANSYNEAVSAGVPQIVLPVWFDTFEFAARVEYLGIGIFASKSGSAPRVNHVEFGDALITITSEKSVEGKRMWKHAKALAHVCNKYGGRATAANKIMETLVSKDKRD